MAADTPIKELLASEGIQVKPKSQCRLMRFIGFFSKEFMTEYFTTYRVPFGRPTIAYPDDIKNPYRYKDILLHECVHVQQFKPWYGPIVVLLMATLLPLPVLFSGRWFIERRAYLRDIKRGCMSAEQAVDTLWRGYIWPWPRPLMRRWFNRKAKDV